MVLNFFKNLDDNTNQINLFLNEIKNKRKKDKQNYVEFFYFIIEYFVITKC